MLLFAVAVLMFANGVTAACPPHCTCFYTYSLTCSDTNIRRIGSVVNYDEITLIRMRSYGRFNCSRLVGVRVDQLWRLREIGNPHVCRTLEYCIESAGARLEEKCSTHSTRQTAVTTVSIPTTPPTLKQDGSGMSVGSVAAGGGGVGTVLVVAFGLVKAVKNRDRLKQYYKRKYAKKQKQKQKKQKKHRLVDESHELNEVRTVGARNDGYVSSDGSQDSIFDASILSERASTPRTNTTSVPEQQDPKISVTVEVHESLEGRATVSIPNGSNGNGSESGGETDHSGSTSERRKKLVSHPNKLKRKGATQRTVDPNAPASNTRSQAKPKEKEETEKD